MLLTKLLFWFLIYCIINSYLIYPLILKYLGAEIESKVVVDYVPYVTLLISAYNEESVIESKIINSLNIGYPKLKLQILVASDGSKDKTSEIVKKYKNQGIELFNLPQNQGKTILQNEAVKLAKGEIIVFSDANAMYQPDAIKQLAKHFADPKVGCVCGELKYVNPQNKAAGEGEGLYWKYEKYLKKLESQTGSIIGANGSIYAVRKDLYEPLPGDIISDFVEPLKIVEKGYRAVYEPDAISIEDTSSSYQKEFKRKVRIITRSIRGLFYAKALLNPLKHFDTAFKLISHKLLRWLVPVFQILIFILNIILIQSGVFYFTTFVGQVLFYLFALIGILTQTKTKVFYIPAYFCMVNYAALLGIKNFIVGEKAISWKPVRD